MDISLIINNFLNPPILFFFLGMLAVFLRSDLEIPQPLAKFFSLYLLMSIGYRGGTELAHSGMTWEVATAMLAAVVMASVVPLYSFFILTRRLKLTVHDSAAIAATYGSVSAVTFITATAFLQKLEISFGGHMVAAMALMESPAIIIGVLLYRLFTTTSPNQIEFTWSSLSNLFNAGKSGDSSEHQSDFSWSELLRDAVFNGSVLMILGSLVIGLLSAGGPGEKALEPFTKDLFRGILTFFLLDMGLVAARRIKDLRKAGASLVGFAILIPLGNALIGMILAGLMGMSLGNALLFVVLCASASYIAVPAAVRLAIPEANPSLYVPMSLAITFPFNIIVGLPLYLSVLKVFWS
ncbi:sodium-dependent bicarbonate transport family permease [Candidatus Contendibacter odensensis]|uniref:Sodium-dependent bicarbonate transport family permease n=1 Tax=Candidatus Contendobacter odensis Run_B_J11 TaxID=1400861 RepID=A0A7U7GFF1_9GAMM|nr:sodium-dependent bicarbonate transport family permease [Candidatus Contendobacter odensis]CDH47383.1 conserved membrane hypothetical protein [Candidatus Contendobacter odensis Run_B_J11]